MGDALIGIGWMFIGACAMVLANVVHVHYGGLVCGALGVIGVSAILCGQALNEADEWAN